MVRHGKAAPESPNCSARCSASGIVSCRQRSASSVADGLVWVSTGYDGHCFWDTERFVLPVLTHTNPSATEDALRWRHDTMPLAEQRAEQLGLSGAAFPWRTINGQECSGYWPAGTAAFHVNADIADAVVRYVDATGNHAFERRTGLPLLVQTARLLLNVIEDEELGVTLAAAVR